MTSVVWQDGFIMSRRNESVTAKRNNLLRFSASAKTPYIVGLLALTKTQKSQTKRERLNFGSNAELWTKYQKLSALQKRQLMIGYHLCAIFGNFRIPHKVTPPTPPTSNHRSTTSGSNKKKRRGATIYSDSLYSSFPARPLWTCPW